MSKWLLYIKKYGRLIIPFLYQQDRWSCHRGVSGLSTLWVSKGRSRGVSSFGVSKQHWLLKVGTTIFPIFGTDLWNGAWSWGDIVLYMFVEYFPKMLCPNFWNLDLVMGHGLCAYYCWSKVREIIKPLNLNCKFVISNKHFWGARKGSQEINLRRWHLYPHQCNILG